VERSLGNFLQNQDLTLFIEALKKEHDEKIDSLRKKTENDIADAISSRRSDVEIRIAQMRNLHKERAQRLLEKNKKRVHNRLRKEFLDEYNNIVAEVVRRVTTRLSELRQDPELYGVIMKNLLDEALEFCPIPCVIFVHVGDEIFFTHDRGVVIKADKTMERWGGCMVMSEKGDFIVDNTFRTRWEKFEPVITRKIAAQANQILREAEFLSRKLRLS